MSAVLEVAVSTVHGRRRWPITLAIAAKEWLDLYRDARWRWLGALMLLLMICALTFGAEQVQRYDRDRTAATESDRKIWTSQGAKDPHAAAHFGQYAFKPQTPLALADPGVDAYVGSAVWLEAHKQNEAQFRPARDTTLVARLGNLSLAFVLQTVIPLVAILLGYAAFAGEREQGTLRQLLSLGVHPTDLLLGKGLALAGAIAVLLTPVLIATLIACIMLTDTAESTLSDQLIRLFGLAAGYTAYIAGFAMLALAVSAFSRNSRAALVGLLAFWLANCFLVPRLMTDAVRTALPLPTALEFRQTIAEEKKKTFGHDETHPAFVVFRDDVLRQYGVERIEDLPVNFRGLALRKDDENGYRIFDQQYGALQEAYERQNRWRAMPGPVFPLLAIQPWSMGMAGTDGRAQYSFTTAAEQHRRVIQTFASDDLIRNGRYRDPTYVADPALWQHIPSFAYREPPVSWVLPVQMGNLLALAGWLAITTLLAVYAVRRMRPI
ncbi:MAG: DUF3526 domain-containing protein [Gammaproteobacteria bacterium]|nr:DUF3526 domain-containing protein [Gammaproteobacteria bacterium]